jgi:pimeloyl-ACP methyl ester carboxylesterase
MAHGIRRRLALLLTCAAFAAAASEPWQRLPPTPALPAHTRSHLVVVNGARLWYAEWGADRPGVPVLLLHGGYANSNYYGRLVPLLVANGYRVLAVDSPGHGRSTRNGDPLSYHLMADDFLGLLDALKIRQVSVVGWSDGGVTGLDLAIRHPERLDRLFAFGANADVSGLKDGVEKDPVFGAYLARVRSEYRHLSPTPAAWGAFDAAMTTMWSTLPAYTAEELRAIRVPTTIADGEYDEGIRPEHLRYLAGAIPGARLVILPRLSHFAMLQDPAVFGAAVLEFLHQGR